MEAGLRAVVVITGASSGIGKSIWEHLTKRGFRAIGASRSLSTDLQTEGALKLDINNPESVKTGLAAIYSQFGQIDVLVNCAGFGIAGSVEDTTIEEAKQQFETNFFGAVRLCQEVLPKMRERHSGKIINISSLGGMCAIPFQAFYSASKCALDSFSEALRLEVMKFGVHVVLLEPGNFKTDFVNRRQKSKGMTKMSAYYEDYMRSLCIMEKDEMNGQDPVKIARLIEKIIGTSYPKSKYFPSLSVTERCGYYLKRFGPSRLYERVASMVFGLN